MLSKNVQISQLIDDIEDAWSGSPWYGRSISDLLSKVKHDSGPIRNLVIHMMAWRTLVLQKLNGQDVNIVLNSETDWPEDTGQSWTSMMDALQQHIDDIITILKTKEDSWLDNPVPGESYNYRFLIIGMIQHDIYHIGQIVILNKMIT